MITSLFVSAALMLAADVPTDPKPVNAVTEAAKAVYIADAAARERGDRSQLLVLGTTHLSGLPDSFDRTRFSPLLDKLEAWAPDRIAIESLSGAQCDYLRAYAFAHEGTADGYCYDTTAARAALGMTGAQAEAEIEATLATLAADRPAPERRRLALLFLASGNPASAAVQWLRLAADERVAGDGLTEALKDELDRRITRKNENIIIGAALAAKLSHERVYPVDDHTGDRATGPVDDKLYDPEIMAAWDNEFAHKRREAYDSWNERVKSDPDMDVLAWYRASNAAEEARFAVAGDFGAQAGAKGPYGAGRKYLAYWETRNMRMAANIREVIGPKGRVLAIVGSSHKPYYERYLGVTSDLEIVDVNEVLSAE